MINLTIIFLVLNVALMAANISAGNVGLTAINAFGAGALLISLYSQLP